MNSRVALMAGAGIGAGMSYLLDPDRGARRRARVKDCAVHTATLARRAVGTTSRDALHRTYGTASALRHLIGRQQVDDDVLVERVRSKLGRLVSHPHAIKVAATDGCVTLTGPVLEREAARLIHRVRGVPGVCDVIDKLDLHEQAGNVPSLQGGRAPGGDRPDLLQQRWAPSTRAAVGVAGVALAAGGILRRDMPGLIAAFTGAMLLARATGNMPVSRLSGIGAQRRAVDVQKTITINAPLGEVYAFWSSYENFPRFMSRVLEVRTSDRRPRLSHWTVAGPLGTRVAFDAETTRVIPNQLIGWKTRPGAPVAHAGIVRFDADTEGGTRVQIRMSYNPSAGWLGHGVAAAFGVDPKHSMDEDLARMKTLIETGHAPHDAAARTAERPSPPVH
jgi:uncharacterized membrane protein